MNSTQEAPLSKPSSATQAVVPPTWSRWSEIGPVVCYPPYLKKTVRTALIVGSILFAINHLDQVLLGQATAAVWIKGAVTYLVPFCVANVGVLIASKQQT